MRLLQVEWFFIGTKQNKYFSVRASTIRPLAQPTKCKEKTVGISTESFVTIKRIFHYFSCHPVTKGLCNRKLGRKFKFNKSLLSQPSELKKPNENTKALIRSMSVTEEHSFAAAFSLKLAHATSKVPQCKGLLRWWEEMLGSFQDFWLQNKVTFFLQHNYYCQIYPERRNRSNHSNEIRSSNTAERGILFSWQEHTTPFLKRKPFPVDSLC